MSYQKKLKIREKFLKLNKEEKINFLKKMTKAAFISFSHDPVYKLRDNQIIPDGNWRYCFVKAGRGFGKTFLGAAWIRRVVDENPGQEGFAAIVGPTHKDVNQIMVQAIKGMFPKDKQPIYNENKSTITFHNKATIHCLSSDQEIRGGNYKYIWCDEIVKWCDSIPSKIKQTFDTMDLAVRIGSPKIVITSTPKPFPIIKEMSKKALEGDPNYIMISGATTDNKNVSPSFLEAMMNKFGGTSLGRQELLGEIMMDESGGLWKLAQFDSNRVHSYPILKRIVIAVDPAVSTNEDSDLTGIIVAGVGQDNHAYVLKDASGKYSPNEWATKVNNLYSAYGADRVVAEKNNGGNLVEANLRTVNANLPIKLVHASQGKITRAEPVAALYEQNKVHHVGNFNQLEDECVSYSQGASDSPDRMDALVWALTELMLNSKVVYRNTSCVPYI